MRARFLVHARRACRKILQWFRAMARYEHLPIYKQAMDVAVHFEKIVAGFSR